MSAAVSYVLRRMQQDGRLAYLIGPGSQTYELLTQEAAHPAGRHGLRSSANQACQASPAENRAEPSPQSTARGHR